jgi:hypothetical protein
MKRKKGKNYAGSEKPLAHMKGHQRAECAHIPRPFACKVHHLLMMCAGGGFPLVVLFLHESMGGEQLKG